MNHIPTWLEGYIKKDTFACIECNCDFNMEGIVGIGIKDAAISKSKTVLFIEYSCCSCGTRTLIELCEMSLTDFALLILEDYEDSIEEEIRSKKEEPKKKEKPKSKRKAKKRNRTNSKITRDEVKKAKEMLDNADSWEDWLNQIGADVNRLDNDYE